jgi:hypothetical protein
MMQALLLHCRLLQFRKNSGAVVLEQEWLNLKMEYQLMEFEVTHFTINKKKRYYVRLGIWNPISHKKRTPGEIWSIVMTSGGLRLPRTSTSLLSGNLAKAVGSLDIVLPFMKHSSTSSDCDSVSSSESEIDDICNSDDNDVVVPPVNLPDASKFPLLHSLFSTHSGHNLYDRLLNEITRFNEGAEINFKRGNNTEGTLVAVPAFRSLEKYKKDLQADSSIIDIIIKAIAKNSKCNNDEASEALLLAIYHKYEDSFLSAAVRQGVANGILPKVMDEVSVEAMLNEAGVNWTNARVIFRHLKQFFGRSVAVSEKKRRAYFGNNDFPPEVGRKVLPDKTVVTYWWKQPDLLLKHQLNDMVNLADLELLSHVDICTGGDHGAGRFRMLLKVLFRFTNRKSTIARRFEIANVSHSNDDIEIINSTVLERIIEGLRNIRNGGRFIVRLNDCNQLSLTYNNDEDDDASVQFNVPIYLYINGDHKFFAQMLGRDGMSTSWCMYCKSHPKDWKGLISVPIADLWSIAQQLQFVERINAGQLKDAKDKKGIVSLPLIDFIEPHHYIFPQLHFEIGTVNNVLDALKGFIEEEVEMLSEAEVEARNSKIISDISYTKAKEKSDQFNTTGGAIELKLFRIERVRVNQALKNRNLAEEERNALQTQRQELDDEIEALSQEQKRLKADASGKRKTFLESSKALKEEQAKKTKLDRPATATMENILSKYEISPARYHGGKLNGVDCREFMSKAKDICSEIQAMLLSVDHPQRCSDQNIIDRCNIYCNILVTLDLISSKIRIKQGHLKDEDMQILRTSIDNLNYLWSHAGMSFTPKIHGMLAHAADQVEHLGGIGDMLEDDLEHLHQVSKKITDRTSKIKDITKQALSHSKIEAKLNNKEIIEKMKESQLGSKRAFKKARIDAFQRAGQAKIERDNSRLETLAEVEQKPYSRIVSFYESEKTKLIEDATTNND